MIRPPAALRKITWTLIALGVIGDIGGCADSPRSELTDLSPAATTGIDRVKPTGVYDISRLANIKHDFPNGFTIDSHPAKALNQQDIDNSGVHVFSTTEISPPQCRSLLLPPYADPSAGSHAAAVLAENGQGTMYVIALGLPQPIPPTDEPFVNCDEASVRVSPGVTGTARRIAAPIIEGVTTTGVEIRFDDGAEPDYIFTAALNTQTTVVVIGSTEPGLDPQRLLSDLLVKATTTVRGP